MCTFGESMMDDAPEKGQEPPKHVRETFRFGVEDASLRERFRAVFLDRIGSHAGVVLKEPIDPTRWRFATYAIELCSAGWGEIHVPGTCVMFQFHDRLRELLALLRQPVLDPARLTGMLILTRPWLGMEDLKRRSRWMRIGDWNGTDELLVYGPPDRREIRAGYLALMTPAERTELTRRIARCLEGIKEP